MVPKENAGQRFDIPEEVLEVLPSDPFEQLDVARKLTSIALSTRVSALESDYSSLTTELSHKDAIIDGLQNLIDSLNSSLAHTESKLSQAHLLKERLKKENASLSDAVKKLNRDVGKLENFRKTLMRSLQDDDENIGGAQHMVAADDASLSSQPFAGEDTASLPSSRAFSIQSQTTDVEHLHAEDHDMDGSWPRISRALLLASQTSTPHLTPGSPPTISSPTSPRRTPTPLSPRQHSISFAATRSMLDDRLSSTPSSHQNLMGYDAGRIRVDGKEFFRQVRNRLSYEQFGAFLANVKELNSHKQTRDETLRKADEIFGADNKDLYALFEGLITRITH